MLSLKMIQKEIESMAKELGLSDWLFETSWAIEDPHSIAEIDIDTIQKYAIIYLNQRHPDIRDTEKRKLTLLHELTHCILQELVQCFDNLADVYIADNAAREEAERRFTDHTEAVVGQLSSTFYKFLRK